MQLAQKGNAVCRIPDSKADYYKELGYSLTDLNEKPAQVGKIHTGGGAAQKKEENKEGKD